MSAIVMRDFGDPDVLRPAQVPTPSPGPGEALVRVAAVEVSRTRDLATRTGRHPFSRFVTPPHILGGHFSGTVVAVGDRVDESLCGKRVAVMNHQTCGHCAACAAGREAECDDLRMLGIHRPGSYAHYATAHAGILHELPDGIGMVEAAALAATGPVALTQLRAAEVRAGSVILVAGLTGALASLLVELGVSLGARIIGLSRRPALVTPRTDLTVLDSTLDDLTEAVIAAADGVQPHAAIDNVCAPDVFERYFPTLACGARIVVSGAIGGPQLPVLPVPARDLYSRPVSLIGVRSHEETATRDFWDMVRAGFRLPPGLLNEYPLEAAADAHRSIQDGTASGHTVLRVSA